MANINSFAENMRRTVTAQTNALNLLESIQESLSTKDTVVAYDYKKLANGETQTYQLPSVLAIINRLQALEENMRNISKGSGTITNLDGTKRKIKVQSLPETPAKIESLPQPTTFSIDSNWFFEDMMFPALQVKLDLTSQIEDSADRVKISRIILDSTQANAQQLWANNLAINDYDYVSLKSLLVYNGVTYAEDIQTIDLPLVSNTAAGTFTIIEDPQIINGNTWYTLDTLLYSTIDSNGTDMGLNNILSVNDRLAYENTLFQIIEINQTANSVRLKAISGSAIPGVYTMFKLYQDPFRKKEIFVKFGANEYDIVYIKGINEDYNLLADSWSTPVKFDTNSLVLETDSEKTLIQYYQENVMDWGANMIAEAKERRLPAFWGHVPNTPVLNAADLRVVQINTQINAALDTADIKNTASEIESSKAQIQSLKSTLAAQKTELQSISSAEEYDAMLQTIATNTQELANAQASYHTLVNTFKTAVKQNEAVLENPKYHIRGFFPIPAYKYRDTDQTIPEEIIGFDIAYRYIREDNTATALNTFSYTDTEGNTVVTGTFTDWVVTQGAIKQRIFDTASQSFIWKTENVADGTEVNINQIDIPISKGEKVEIKVRSISEAGYPDNPRKSEWSETITVSFPDTLSTQNAVADLIKEINDDALLIAIDNNLDSIGVSAHLDDSVANSNSVNGLFYKHMSKNIAYEYRDNTEGTVTSYDLLTVLTNIIGRLENIEAYLTDIASLVNP